MLDGKNILVTGASTGIGCAMAKYFSSQGAEVVLVSRSKEKLLDVAKDLPNPSHIFPADLTVLENVKAMFDFCKANGLKLDGIAHCAGLTMSLPLRANDISKMEAIMRVNVEALAEICKFAAKKSYTNDGAAIVAMSSSASLCGDKGIAIYSASKAAVNILVKSAAIELASRNIRVNAIAPAMVRTEMYYETIRAIPAMEGVVAANQPFGLIEPEYLAYLAEFLLSEKAKYISGSIVVVGAGHVF